MRVPLLVVSLLAAGAAAAAPPAGGSAGAPAPRSTAPASSLPGPGPAPSRQGRALSRALVPQKTWDNLLDRSAEGLSAAISHSLEARGEKVPSDLQTTIRGELGKSMKYEQAVDAQAQALQKRFSPSELEQAAKFYETPLGKKMLTELPAAQGEVGDELQQRLASVVPDIIHRVAPSVGEGAGPSSGSPASPASPSPPTGTGEGAAASSPHTGAAGSSGTSGKGL